MSPKNKPPKKPKKGRSGQSSTLGGVSMPIAAPSDIQPLPHSCTIVFGDLEVNLPILPGQPNLGRNLFALARGFFDLLQADIELYDSGSNIVHDHDPIVVGEVYTVKLIEPKVPEHPAVPPLRFTNHSMLQIADDLALFAYGSDRNCNDYRRAYSLTRWRVIHKAAFIRNRDSSLKQCQSQGIQENFQKFFQFIDQLDDCLQLPGVDLPNQDNFDQPATLSNIKQSILESDSDFAVTLSCFLAEICMRKANFCFESRHEIQFHAVWKDILNATMVYGPNIKSYSLNWEYHINRFVAGYQGDHLIDLMLLSDNLPVVFVEITATLIADRQDHQDFQKMAGGMSLALHQIIDLYRSQPMEVLKNFRVFGIFVTRFEYEFVYVRPEFENDNVSSVIIILETNRDNRHNLLGQQHKRISCIDSAQLDVDTERPTESVVADRNSLRDYAFQVDALVAVEVESDDRYLFNQIHRALSTWTYDLALPLLQFGEKIRRYISDISYSQLNQDPPSVQYWNAFP